MDVVGYGWILLDMVRYETNLTKVGRNEKGGSNLTSFMHSSHYNGKSPLYAPTHSLSVGQTK